MMKKPLVYILFFTLLFSSCSSLEDIEINEVKGYKINSLKDNVLRAEITLEVENPTLYPITIKDLDLRAQINGRYIGKVILDESIKVKAKQTSDVIVPVSLKISNIMTAAFLMLKLKDTNQLKIEVEGIGHARSFFISKEFEVKESYDIGELEL